MRMQWTLIAALVFALLITLFALANMDPVPVQYWFGQSADFPLILVILISALLGGLSIGSIGMVRQYRLQRQLRRLERQLAEQHGSDADGLQDLHASESEETLRSDPESEVNEPVDEHSQPSPIPPSEQKL
ncbi:DUF1049 domain-containing protein [Xylanibacillus composti]|uniref:Lipopolysaccharide assembly protein A domain-containing protein n=1 Tax=Xylanibacillus composti TaxID=1572762 RepID=A0A8J4H244_9BACL|nr:lipopolysaccharide assembly protein LapA domain-containing protein [Xylanibacillus composti]MDT9724946.1 DUF1049 domain-containing protein [Xylanibacillus composti]GIQ68185.1 hypothetical protein XYCOK13_10090 [Xylanibacillus composti]